MIISTPSKFLIESSSRPIYQRIINTFKKALLEIGHTVSLIDTTNLSSLEEYLLLITAENPDFLLSISPSSTLVNYWESLDGYIFEITNIPIIFVHYDNIFSNLYSSDIIQKKLTSFYRTREKSWHFCLEYDNFLDLRSLGINNTFSISHASEFVEFSPVKNYTYEVSFLGHVLPDLSLTLEGYPFSHLLQSHLWNRIVSLNTRLSLYGNEFAANHLGGIYDCINFLSLKYFYISLLHVRSQAFRGEILKRIDKGNVSIIGGDPAYINRSDRKLVINKENIKYYPPQNDQDLALKIYRDSKINLNITSLQFDDAVINRVIDTAAIGGFVLTDWRSDLVSLTEVHQEISYKSIEELNEKIAYYLHPDHYRERLDIAEALHQDVRQKCNYLSIVESMIAQINASENTMSEPLRIDLGCGTWKPEGFIGVDISPSPNVDVVANLNRRFPFSDNSAEIIRAHDVVEHLDNRIHTMNELWRISKPDGLIDIRVPSTDGRGAFQDPTHVSFWNINSFMYYCIEYPAYLQLNQTYGFKGAFRIESMEHERAEGDVVHVRTLLRAVKQYKDEKYNDYIDGLKSINILICPDWHENDENLYRSLHSFLSIIFHHPQKQDISILVGITEHSSKYVDVDSLLSDIALNLIFEENIDVSDGEPNILFVPMEDRELLKYLEPHIFKIINLANTDFDDLKKLFIDRDITDVQTN